MASRDKHHAVMLEGEPPLNGFLQRVFDFEDALRRSGVEVALSEGIESVRMLRHLELTEREHFREGLAAVTVKNHSHRRAFDDLFEIYFPARRGDTPDLDGLDLNPDENGDIDQDEFLKELMRQLMDGDESSIRRLAQLAVEQFGRVEGRDGGESFFQYRVFRAIDLQEILADMLREAGADDDQITALQERLLRDEFEARVKAFREEVEAEIRRRAAEQRGADQVADRMVKPPLEEVDFFRLSSAEQAEMRSQIRPLARKLATRTQVKRKLGKDGKLDVRKTVRKSMSTGGVPFDPTFKPRKPHKPELHILCDVSGSVASFARFTLMLVYTLQEQFSKVRSYAFIDTLDEVTGMFETGDFQEGMKRMISDADLVWFDGHSDYGHSFSRFHEEYIKNVSPKATVLILGDGRNNYRATNAWVLQDLQHRARRVFWLNPEPKQFWDTGDSVASSYARYTDEMVECRNLKQLTEFVTRLA